MLRRVLVFQIAAIVLTLGFVIRDEEWSPIVGFERSSYLSPTHSTELDLLNDDVISFTIDDFEIKTGMLGRLEIKGLKANHFTLDKTNVDFIYEFEEASYKGKDFSADFEFSYVFWEDGVFRHEGTGSFTASSDTWHFIDKRNVVSNNLLHIVTFQIGWDADLKDFKVSEDSLANTIEEAIQGEMDVRVSMGLEHSVN